MSIQEAATITRTVVDAVTDAFGVAPDQTNVLDKSGGRYDAQIDIRSGCQIPDLDRLATKLGAHDLILRFDPGNGTNYVGGTLKLTLRGLRTKAERVELSARQCECDLRDRLWNGYGKCLRCSGRYEVGR